MEIKLSPKLKKEMPDIKKYGYSSWQNFIEDAVRHWIISLNKKRFAEKSGKIQKALQKLNLKEEDILDEFEKFIHRK